MLSEAGGKFIISRIKRSLIDTFLLSWQFSVYQQLNIISKRKCFNYVSFNKQEFCNIKNDDRNVRHLTQKLTGNGFWHFPAID